MADTDSITRNVNLDRETDKVVLQKLADMTQAGGRSISYSAAVRELVADYAEATALLRHIYTTHSYWRNGYKSIVCDTDLVQRIARALGEKDAAHAD